MKALVVALALHFSVTGFAVVEKGLKFSDNEGRNCDNYEMIVRDFRIQRIAVELLSCEIEYHTFGKDPVTLQLAVDKDYTSCSTEYVRPFMIGAILPEEQTKTFIEAAGLRFLTKLYNNRGQQPVMTGYLVGEPLCP